MLRMIKGIALPDCLHIQFAGTVMQNAICFGDVDNDGHDELVVGNTNGTVAVYKGLRDEPWRVCHDLGLIAAVGVGDLRNDGSNVLVVINGHGWFYIFDFNAPYVPRIRVFRESANESSSSEYVRDEPTWLLAEPRAAPASDSNLYELSQPGPADWAGSQPLKTRHRSDEPSVPLEYPSTLEKSVEKAATSPRLEGIDHEDGGAADSLKDSESDASSCQSELNSIHVWYRQRIPANVKEVLIFDLNNDGINEVVLALTDRVVRTYQWKPRDPLVEEHREKDAIRRMKKGKKHGKIRRRRVGVLKPVQKWEFGNQIGSITHNRNQDGSNTLILAQPGGGMLKLISRPALDLRADDSPEELMAKIGEVNHTSLNINELRHFTTSAEIKGNLRTQEVVDGASDCQSTPYVVSTLTGTIIFVRDEQVQWTVETNQPLFCVRRLRLEEDKADFIVACAWSGNTYILDQSGKPIEFVFDQNVATFTCGQYSADNRNRPAMVYTTSDGDIYLYFNVDPVQRLIHTAQDLERDKDLAELLASVGIAKVNGPQLADITAYLLCGSPRLTASCEINAHSS